LPQQFQSFKTPLLQRSEIPSHSSRITHAEKTEFKLSRLRYIMRNSVVWCVICR
jgi:hypothetical protein